MTSYKPNDSGGHVAGGHAQMAIPNAFKTRYKSELKAAGISIPQKALLHVVFYHAENPGSLADGHVLSHIYQPSYFELNGEMVETLAVRPELPVHNEARKHCARARVCGEHPSQRQMPAKFGFCTCVAGAVTNSLCLFMDP